MLARQQIGGQGYVLKVRSKNEVILYIVECSYSDDTSVLLTTEASGNGPQISIPPPGFIATLSLSAL
jgi:hypothetical protein